MTTRSVMISKLENGIHEAVSLGGKEKKRYIDGQATQELESVVVELAVDGVGTCQFVLPYRDGLLNDVSNSLPFGQKVDLAELYDITDIQVSIYKDALTIKYLGQEK